MFSLLAFTSFLHANLMALPASIPVQNQEQATIPTRPSGKAPVTRALFENILTEFQCQIPADILEKKAAADFLNKSDVVRSIATLMKNTEGFTPSPLKSTIRFYDVDSDADHYEAAQLLADANVLQVLDGHFGFSAQVQRLADPDPQITIWHTKLLLERTFLPGQCAVIQDDLDNDGAAGAADLCPTVPADTEDGCPEVPFMIQERSSTPRAVLTPTPEATETLTFLEETEIQLGDIFRAVFQDPKTKQIWGSSNEVEVKR